ncbi:hypothetical protein H7347_06960 [Corynebacterium sp. zg-331]|uniref:hypothetical protein n=1 Tax=unclassified Corynebacterium TaxID=2624378 RepID=UPI00128C2EC6|nr:MULTISPECIES: hypothetical protein [unclassified Corynebacterium]MBC3186312.1 hypothetical protein [Corynebacterium sp. zg-331]MPV52800.1 hypothetical protein [Corynebacterium sp. zg331]
MEHTKWFTRLTNGASALAASKQASPQLNNATLSRQLNRGTFSAEVVIALARGYNASPVEALAQTGYLRTSEATGQAPEAIAQLLSDQDLIRELARRIDDDASAWSDTFDHTLQSATTSVPAAEDDLAARREGKPEAKSETGAPAAAYDDMSDDELIDRINAGQERIVAQKRTPPLEEEWT